MKPAPQYEFSAAQDKALKKARIIEYITLAYLTSVIILMYLVMGSSQAMKTAWIEDCLSLIPPLCFLAGTRLCWRKPTEHYPYGFHRIISILYLCAALALLLMGTYLLVDALMKLGQQEPPTIGMKEFFGQDIWLGWWMIAVLLWGTFPPVVLGRMKLKPAKILNDKILMTDGKMNKADWLTAAPAIGGVLGIGMGWWWADAAAAAFISLDIVKDGWQQSRDAVTGLVNRAPTAVDGDYIDLPDRVRGVLERHPEVAHAEVRLYEHGHLVFGEGFLQLRGQGMDAATLQQLTEEAQDEDWRLQSLTLTLRTNEKET